MKADAHRWVGFLLGIRLGWVGFIGGIKGGWVGFLVGIRLRLVGLKVGGWIDVGGGWSGVIENLFIPSLTKYDGDE